MPVLSTENRSGASETGDLLALGQYNAVDSANLQALQTLFTVSDMQSLLPEDSRSVAGSVNFVFKSIIGAADQIDLPIDEAIADDEQRGKLDFMALNTRDLLDRVNRDFGGAIGLGAGFSFADGD